MKKKKKDSQWKQGHNQSWPDGQLRLIASSFNQLDQYVCSPGCEKIEQK